MSSTQSCYSCGVAISDRTNLTGYRGVGVLKFALMSNTANPILKYGIYLISFLSHLDNLNSVISIFNNDKRIT